MWVGPVVWNGKGKATCTAVTVSAYLKKYGTYHLLDV
jgi:hypothetical protein